MSSEETEKIKAKALHALGQIQDPDLHKDIVTAGFIKNLSIKSRMLGGFEIDLEIELTTPACPIKDLFKKQATDGLMSIEGCREVRVTMSARVRPSGSQFPGQKPVPHVRKVILVASGKGGVGKSTVSSNLACALAAQGARVGLLDTDIYGPSIGIMFGVQRMPEVKNHRMIPVLAHSIRVMTFAFFAPVGEAVIWRGAMLGKAVEQMLFEVNWAQESSSSESDLDYLIVDTPPGTGDVHLALIHHTPIAGVVLVSTPQEVAIADTQKSLAFFEKMRVPVLGAIENMSGFMCPNCQTITPIFGSDGFHKWAQQREIPFFAKIPLDPQVVARGDHGVPLFAEQPEHPISKMYASVASQVAHRASIVEIASNETMVP